jgi:DNA-binding transcriptional MerR regulator/effector-binding domain-containing protein
MFRIGEFSKITALPVKTLRFYHEQGLLPPTHVDEQTGYRYYGENQVETARIITQLRALGFSLEDIKNVLAHQEDDSDLLDYLERQRQMMQEKAHASRRIARALTKIINHEREAQQTMNDANFNVEEKAIEPLWIAGVRMKGRYGDCGKGFAKIGKRFGRRICGKPLLLHYDAEYKEADADFEACMPIQRKNPNDQANSYEGVSVRELPGGRCVTLLHKGPYEELGRSYERILAYVQQRGYEIISPTREVYLKGPGMIFRGNPKNYLTEIQMLIVEQGGRAP